MKPETVDESGWWESLFCSSSDTFTRKKLVREYDGIFQGCGLELLVDVARIQWRLYPLIKMDEPPESFPNLGSFPSVLESFDSLMRKWLPSCPAIVRIAFGAQLVHPMESRESAYELLGQYLPDVQVDPRSTDFLFQVNRPRNSRCIPGLTMNRLTKWSASSWQLTLMPHQGTNTKKITLPSQTGARLELDLSSSGDTKEQLPGEQLSILWHELIGMAQEIAAEGDKP
jgi:hypothetical protein